MESSSHSSKSLWGKVRAATLPMSVEQQIIRFTIKGMLEGNNAARPRTMESENGESGVEDSTESFIPAVSSKQMASSKLISTVIREKMAEADLLTTKKMENMEV